MTDPVTATNFIDGEAIRNFAVATTAVFAVSMTIRRTTGISHPVVPLFVALALTFTLAATDGKLDSVLNVLLALVNACLLFLAAVGANETVTEGVKETPAGQGEKQGKRARTKRWLGSYFE